MKSINPANNQVIGEYKEHTPKEAAGIIEQADKAFGRWRVIPIAERALSMRKAASVLRENKEKFARLITLEMGKIIAESRAEVEKCAWVCDYYAEKSTEFLQDEIIATDASRSLVSFAPLGVILAVMPWNFPFWQVFRFAAPALMAGNGAILKHASNVSGCALAIESVFKDAGFMDNIFRTLLIRSDLVEEVIKNEAIKAATLTGSEPAGSSVASIAGRELKKTVLELGGSDPYIVLEDADLQKCVEVSLTARMLNAGQSCIAAKRFIVVDSVAEEFAELQAKAISALRLGDPLDEATQVGPLARGEFLDQIDLQVKKSIDLGARLLCGGKKADLPGAYYLPTVLADVKKGMPAFDEETFGPVSAIIPVEDFEQAITVANDSRFGLGGSIWSRDLEKAERAARMIESGAVFVNGMTKSDPRLPFGGIKKSGYGRELSHYGIKEFVNIKSIWIA